LEEDVHAGIETNVNNYGGLGKWGEPFAEEVVHSGVNFGHPHSNEPFQAVAADASGDDVVVAANDEHSGVAVDAGAVVAFAEQELTCVFAGTATASKMMAAEAAGK
jgi:hypothetical protein